MFDLPFVTWVKPELSFEGLVAELDGGQRLELDHLAAQPVLAVPQLDELPDGVPHRPVVIDHDGLHGLYETTLDVAGLGRLDGRVDQTLSAAHGVKVEFGRGQAG